MGSNEEYLDNLLKTMLEDSVNKDDKKIQENNQNNILEDNQNNILEDSQNIILEDSQTIIQEQEPEFDFTSIVESQEQKLVMEQAEMGQAEMVETEINPAEHSDLQLGFDTLNAKDFEMEELEEKELEVEQSEVEQSEVEQSEIELSEIKSVEYSESELGLDISSMKETEVEAFEIEDMEIQESEIEESVIQESEIEELVIQELEVQELNTQESEIKAEDNIEELEAMFDFANIEESEEEQTLELEIKDDTSVTELLDALGEDEDLAEINELLKKNDDNVLVEDDMMDLLNGFQDEPSENRDDNSLERAENSDFDIFADTGDEEEPIEEQMGNPVDELDVFELMESKSKEVELEGLEDIDSLLREKTDEEEKVTKPKKEKRIRREKRAPKEKGSTEGEEVTGEPKGFLAKLFATLFEADEELDAFDSVTEGTMPSDENIEILKELDKEKGKKNKVKKAKKGKTDQKSSAKAGEEDGDEEELDEKSKKKAKAKKPKKEKKKVEETPPEKEKKVSKKKIIQIASMCFSLMVVILVMVNFIPNMLENAIAKSAFYKGNYVETYQMLYGKKMTKNEELIFNKTETILKLDRKYQSFLGYQAMEKPLEAIDALMQGVQIYDRLLVKAEEYGAVEAFNAVYATILEALQSNYGITEADAKEIVAYEDDYDYTKRLQSIVFGTEFVDPNVPEIESEVLLEDMLPEEEGLMLDSSVEDSLSDENMTITEPENEETENEETGTMEPIEAEDGTKEIPIISADIEITE